MRKFIILLQALGMISTEPENVPVDLQQKRQESNNLFPCLLAESEGFKPPIPERGIPDFESSAIDHSANSPFLFLRVQK